MAPGTDLAHPGERRVGGLWLILYKRTRVLVVNPNYGGYTGSYQLVGGGAAPDEPVHLAAVREAQLEIGLTLVPHTLLVTDYMPANPDRGAVEGLNFVFLHHLAPGEPISLNAGTPLGEKPGLLGYKLLTADEVDSHCAPYQARRIRAAMEAAADPNLRGYLHEGHRITAGG